MERHRRLRRQRVHIQNVNVIIVQERTKICLWNFVFWMYNLFVPEGYPDSVSNDYSKYQIYYLLQLFCGSVAGILALREVLHTLELAEATIVASTVTLIFNDVLGEIGKELYTGSRRIIFDVYSKRWQIYADTINNAVMCLEMAISAFGKYAIVVVYIGTIFKTIEGITRTTRAALTAHHATRDNTEDLAAKAAAQETVVKVLASVTSVLLMCYVGHNGFVFCVMVFLHAAFNYLSVCSVCLNTVNETRFVLMMKSYLVAEFVPTTSEVSHVEPILREDKCYTVEYLTGFKIKMGVTMEEMLRRSRMPFDFELIERVYCEQAYVLYPDLKEKIIYIMMKPGSLPNMIICAHFHAVLLAIIINSINKKNLSIIMMGSHNFVSLYQTIMSSDWPRSLVRYPTINGLRYEPSEDLLLFMLTHVEIEWTKFYTGLLRSGWVSNRHLFVSEDWTVGYDPEEPDPNLAYYDTEYSDVPVEFNTFNEALEEAVLNRNAELNAASEQNSAANIVPLHVIQPAVEVRPDTSEETRRRWIEDNEITHIGACVIRPRNENRRRRHKKD